MLQEACKVALCREINGQWKQLAPYGERVEALVDPLKNAARFLRGQPSFCPNAGLGQP